jgi:AraC family transcriptional regulator of adaptative response/methylated-DNA-[protein]-cysteine methyltransferase
MPMDDYARIEKAILFLEFHYRNQPPLREVAASVDLSEYHFQRLFRRWVGISPKRFTQYLTAEYAERLLQQSQNVLDVAYESGLSSAGRLHDLFVNLHGVTPGEVKALGAGLTIRFGVHASPFGSCLLSVTERGLCGLAFLSSEGKKEALADLEHRWPAATLREKPAATRPIVEKIFAVRNRAVDPPIDLYAQGTNFQIKVWEALLRIPPGSVLSYEAVAERIGAPGASRAVGVAVARNPVAFLIPCHRVIQKSGLLGQYRWSAARKKAILGWEAARAHLKETTT